ncbi:MAG: sulfatase-like hydrolase/transferase [Candidatus Latescibacteria bacterium]|nr:sulfatase-like hydrolase/transferase [Candidatus Latescibacterota bacterium]
MSLQSRREFLKTTGGALTAVTAACAGTDQKRENRPNILIFITDQQHSSMMSCAGNKYVKTPALDSLAASGIRFNRAYCADPVCIPSRFSLMTGRMPGEIGLRSNDLSHIDGIPEHILQHGMGTLFRSAGYDAAYGGKVHLPKMNAQDIGFEYICPDERNQLADVCSEYIRQKRERPFLLFASFINPHDICYMAIRDFAITEQAKQLIERGKTEVETLDLALRLPGGVSREEFFREYCPPVPANFEPQQDEPEAIKMLLAQRPFRKNARENWPEERWRLHRRAYCRLTEMVDAQIGSVLKALRESGKEKDTLVIFTSDHGDMDSAHRMEHKTAFYDEACRIPFIARRPEVTPAGFVNSNHLISNGLDLFPTLCDYAAIEVPAGLKGKSLRPLIEGHDWDNKRSFIPVESEIGHMIVTEDYKYQVYDAGKNSEQLIDLRNDPGEMRNSVSDPDKKEIVNSHRELYRKTYG